MSKGLSCVVTDVGGNQEIIENGKTGYIVPPQDPKSLAEKIIFLLKNKETAERIGLGASAIVRSKFSHETMLSQYEALYNSLIPQ
jgi:glycosyltransferase involved in cell wall biosynthesis